MVTTDIRKELFPLHNMTKIAKCILAFRFLIPSSDVLGVSRYRKQDTRLHASKVRAHRSSSATEKPGILLI